MDGNNLELPTIARNNYRKGGVANGSPNALATLNEIDEDLFNKGVLDSNTPNN